MATDRVKKIIVWVVFAFVLYAIFTNPDQSASIVHQTWDLLVSGVHNMGKFFDRIMGR